MHILAATDAFKGSYSAREINAAIAQELREPAARLAGRHLPHFRWRGGLCRPVCPRNPLQATIRTHL